MFSRVERAYAAAFGHAKILDQIARPARQDLRLQGRREIGAAAGLHPKRREVEAIEVGLCEDTLKLDRHHHRVRDAMSFRKFEVTPSVELAHQHDSATHGQGW